MLSIKSGSIDTNTGTEIQLSKVLHMILPEDAGVVVTSISTIVPINLLTL